MLVSSINVKPLLLCCKRERIDVWRWCTTRCRWCITCRYLEERLVGQYPSAKYFKYPSADFFKYPSADYLKYPSAKYFNYPSAHFFKYPSAKYFKYPSADYFKYSSAKYFKYPSVDYFSKIPLQASQRQEIRQGREEELDSPKIVSKRIKMEFLKRGRTQITSKIYSRLILILSIPDIRFSWIEYRVSRRVCQVYCKSTEVQTNLIVIAKTKRVFFSFRFWNLMILFDKKTKSRKKGFV